MLGESPRVMIVDDDPVTCDLLCEVFRKEGFETRFEQSSAAALSALDLYEPDVVLSDIRMGSRNDGLNLLTEIRREHPGTPVVLMTAFGSIDTAVLAVREGAYDYISKPFMMDEVVSTVRRALTASSTSFPHSPSIEDTEE